MANPLDKALASPGYKKYAADINAAAKSVSASTGVPEQVLSSALTALAARESEFKPNAKGPKLDDGTHALGIMQYRPTTAKTLGLNPLDPQAAIMQAAKDAAVAFKRGGMAEIAASHFAGAGGGNRGPNTRAYVTGFLGDMAQLGAPAHQYVAGQKPARGSTPMAGITPKTAQPAGDVELEVNPFASAPVAAAAPSPEINPFQTMPDTHTAAAADPFAQYQEMAVQAPVAPPFQQSDLNPFGGFDARRDPLTLKFFEQQIEHANG